MEEEVGSGCFTVCKVLHCSVRDTRGEQFVVGLPYVLTHPHPDQAFTAYLGRRSGQTLKFET